MYQAGLGSLHLSTVLVIIFVRTIVFVVILKFSYSLSIGRPPSAASPVDPIRPASNTVGSFHQLDTTRSSEHNVDINRHRHGFLNLDFLERLIKIFFTKLKKGFLRCRKRIFTKPKKDFCQSEVFVKFFRQFFLSRTFFNRVQCYGKFLTRIIFFSYLANSEKLYRCHVSVISNAGTDTL